MKEQLSALYELRSLDVSITRINARLASLGGAQEMRARLADAKSALGLAESKLTSHETELIDSELKLKSLDEKRAGFEKRLYGGSVTHPKELGAIEKEVKMLKSQQGQLDGRTLELYDLVDKAREEAGGARQAVADLEDQIKAALEQESEEKARLEADLADTTNRRGDVAPKVTDKALLARYEVVRKKTGGTGIAKGVEGKCEGCRISITPFTARMLYEDKEHVCCESCGRILFLDTTNE